MQNAGLRSLGLNRETRYTRRINPCTQWLVPRTYNRVCIQPEQCTAPYPVRLARPRDSLSRIVSTALRVVRDARTLKATGLATVSNVLDLAGRRRVSSPRAREKRTRRPERVHHDAGPRRSRTFVHLQLTRRKRGVTDAAPRAGQLSRGLVGFQSLSAPARSRRRVQQHRHKSTVTGRWVTHSQAGCTQHRSPKASDY